MKDGGRAPYQTKGGAQQYGSPEAFEKADELAFERYLKQLMTVLQIIRI